MSAYLFDCVYVCLSVCFSGPFSLSLSYLRTPLSLLLSSYPQVKPGMPYLDVIRRLRESSNLPISAYHVSGEYAMMKAAVERGWLDERAAVLEVRPGSVVYLENKQTIFSAVVPCFNKRYRVLCWAQRSSTIWRAISCRFRRGAGRKIRITRPLRGSGAACLNVLAMRYNFPWCRCACFFASLSLQFVVRWHRLTRITPLACTTSRAFFDMKENPPPACSTVGAPTVCLAPSPTRRHTSEALTRYPRAPNRRRHRYLHVCVVHYAVT